MNEPNGPCPCRGNVDYERIDSAILIAMFVFTVLVILCGLGIWKLIELVF